MDLKTPGREDSEEVKLYHREDMETKKNGQTQTDSVDHGVSEKICEGLGGKENIVDVDCCATRLRCTVAQADKVNKDLLRATGASGVIQKGDGVQVVYGPRVTVIKSQLEDYLAGSVENKERRMVISSPYTGNVVPLEDTPDEAFASGALGKGASVELTGADIAAPEDGTVLFVFNTKHAIGFRTKDGLGMLFHVGIDTVKLGGQGFEVFVKDGDEVKKGDLLMRVDLEYLRANAPSLVSPILCTELDEDIETELLCRGTVHAGEDLFALK